MHISVPDDKQPILRWAIALALILLIGAVLVGCGGGGDDSKQETTAAISADQSETAEALHANNGRDPWWIKDKHCRRWWHWMPEWWKKKHPCNQGNEPGYSIKWNPESVTTTIAPGTRQEIKLTLSSTTDLRDVTLTPLQLAGLVQVEPRSFRLLRAGQSASVKLVVAPSTSSALATTEGAIEVSAGRAGAGTPFAVTVIVATGAVGLLPPDPGEAGKATLAGIDSNSNGVRDDVERHIWLTFPTSEKARSALVQSALASQKLILNSGSVEEQRLAILSASRCGYAAFSPTDTVTSDGMLRAQKVNRTLREIIINTPNRLSAYLAGDARFGGAVYSMPPITVKDSLCSASLSSFPN